MTEVPALGPEHLLIEETTREFHIISDALMATYCMPRLADHAGIVFKARGLNEESPNDTIQSPSTPRGDFVFNLDDFSHFFAEFDSFFDFRLPDASERVRVARTLFLGVGVASFVCEQQVRDPRVPATRTRLDAIREIFSNTTDLTEMFKQVGFEEAAERLVSHMLQANILKTNGYKVGLRYLFDALPDLLGNYDYLKLQEQAILVVLDALRTDAYGYVDLAVSGFGGSQEQGEKTFVHVLPSWLIALASPPIKHEQLRGLHSRGWQR